MAMQEDTRQPNAERLDTRQDDLPVGSRAVPLSLKQWLVSLGVATLLTGLIPALWTRIEPLKLGSDYRVPFRLSHDYWMIRRYVRRAARENRTLVLGDSVVWGHYVGKGQTLSHYLNQLSGGEHFINLGIDGTHPAAMAGLIQQYGRDIRGRRVLVHCNLLWMSSRRHDLTTEKETNFNHPKLIPQFFPSVPSYRASLSARIGAVVQRRVPLLSWAEHLRIAYFQGTDLPTWTLEHPYENPANAITLALPSPDEPPSPKPVAKPWTTRGLRPFNPPWVPLETSLQWASFRQTVTILRRRENQVFVLVGPLNEHMLSHEIRQVYRRVKQQVRARMDASGIACWVPEALASEDYADASHPLAAGYRTLARQLLQQDSFRQFQFKGDDFD